MSEPILAHLKLARGDLGSSLAILTKNEQVARRYDFLHRIPNVISARVMMANGRVLLHCGAQRSNVGWNPLLAR